MLSGRLLPAWLEEVVDGCAKVEIIRENARAE